jgi:glycosyltransferase involved in cell wall biosynthesis
MKVLIAQPYLNLRGGAERVILEIAKHYDAKVLTMEYIKNSTFPEFQDVDIEIIGKDVPLAQMLPYRAHQGLTYGYNFYNYKETEDYDIINSHISPSEWIRHKNKRVLWYCHTPPREVYDLYTERMKNRSTSEKLIYASFTKAYKIISRGVVTDLEYIATNSKNTRDRIKKYFNRDAAIVSPGIDAGEFRNSEDGKYFLYPSRIVANKRQDYVINAFNRFVRISGNENYKLVLAGSLSNNDEHHEYYKKLIKMKTRNILFKLNVGDKELKNLYSNATAVLFAAINEDFGIVPLEAMASSKPIISVNEGGPRETIVNGITGYTVDSYEEMADRMKFIVEHPSIAEEMGRQGRKRIENNFSWKVFFKKFDALARKVADM